MSGGALNYLQNQDLYQLSVNADLTDVIGYLKENPLGSKAAKYSQHLKNILEEVTAIRSSLLPVWEIMDKYLSNDCSNNEVDCVLAKFNTEQSPIQLDVAQTIPQLKVAQDINSKSDNVLFQLIAENTKQIKRLQNLMGFTTNREELVQLTTAIANLTDSQSKLVAIAHQQNPELKRVFDYAEHLSNNEARADSE